MLTADIPFMELSSGFQCCICLYIPSVAMKKVFTLLRSFVVTPSSSRQGNLCTKASIWYLALMNSDLVGLQIKEANSWMKIKMRVYRKKPCQWRQCVTHNITTDGRGRTYWTLSCGLGFLRPLCTWAGSSRLCSQIEFAPLLAKVWTIWNTHVLYVQLRP